MCRDHRILPFVDTVLAFVPDSSGFWRTSPRPTALMRCHRPAHSAQRAHRYSCPGHRGTKLGQGLVYQRVIESPHWAADQRGIGMHARGALVSMIVAAGLSLAGCAFI